MMMNEKDFSIVIGMITHYTGIVPKDSHREGIRHYVEKQIENLSVANPDFDYIKYMAGNPIEVENLVNAATVNETYFFREENQYKLLKNKIFPELRLTAGGPVNIWSAASSSGEEIYSLALLAKNLHLAANFTASDINTAVLEQCRAGVYKKNSMRTVDGAAFSALLEPYKSGDRQIKFDQDLISKIDIRHLNLIDLLKDIPQSFPTNQHLIFVRNVFIYFSREMKARILKSMVDNCMAVGGYLFVSTNEIPSFDSAIVPKNLRKVSDDNVFYFRKEAE